MNLNNSVRLIGHTGDEIKMHYFEGGGCIGRLSLATNSQYKNKAGETVKETEWHNLVFRNKVAELVEKYVKKGHRIAIEGAIKTRKWQDDAGNDRYSTEINVRDFMFLEKSGGSQTTAQQPTAQQPAQDAAQTPEPSGDDNDDLPF